MAKPKRTDPNTILSELCFLYLACSHATDNELSDAELDMIIRCVRVWAPGQSIKAVDAVLERTLVLYTSISGRVEKLKTASRCAFALRDKLDHDQREAIIRDLARIASADGHVIARERTFVEATARSFGVEMNNSMWP